MKKTTVAFTFVLALCNVHLDAIIFGSNTAPSVQSLANFPSTDGNNTMLGFGAFTNGFTLANSAVVCLFNSFFPISGNMTFNGGLLNLDKNLVLSSSATIVNGGNLNCEGLSVSLPDMAATFTIPGSMVFGSSTVLLNSNVTLTGVVTFTSNCLIDGGGYILDCTLGSLVVGTKSSLLLKDLTLKNASGSRLFCVDNTGTFSLQNVTWILDANYSFTQGILDFFYNIKLTGAQQFTYKSSKTSTIHSDSTLLFDAGMTFSYDTNSNSLLAFQDNTAYLHLYETTWYVNSLGLKLTKGNLVIDGQCPVLSAATSASQGISFGDGISTANDLTVMVLAESGLNLQSGFIVYQNV